jgi:K+-sensing histidine kinase KdpD
MTYFVQSMMKYRDDDLPITLRATGTSRDVTVSAELVGNAPMRRLGHIFETASESNVEQRGSGLGLYICKRFVETRGGRMWMERWGDEGEGARICFSLPTTPVHTHRRG